MIKAVLDTNVLISGIFWKGTPFEILEAWERRRFQLVISRPILTEYSRVLEEMTKKRSLPAVPSILEIIQLQSEMIEPVAFPKFVCSDPGDDKFLEAAVASNARYLVSGDSALLNLRNYSGVEIVRPKWFLNLLSHRPQV